MLVEERKKKDLPGREKFNNVPGGYQHRLLMTTFFRENLSIVDGPFPNCALPGGRPLYGHPGVAHAHAGADK